MWVFDGEQWTEEGGSSEQAPKTEPKLQIDQFQPEIQVVDLEVVQIVPRAHRVPMPFPMH